MWTQIFSRTFMNTYTRNNTITVKVQATVESCVLCVNLFGWKRSSECVIGCLKPWTHDDGKELDTTFGMNQGKDKGRRGTESMYYTNTGRHKTYRTRVLCMRQVKHSFDVTCIGNLGNQSIVRFCIQWSLSAGCFPNGSFSPSFHQIDSKW